MCRKYAAKKETLRILEQKKVETTKDRMFYVEFDDEEWIAE